ncbi:MAG: DUF1730 domain-containing protein [Clostridia bacterium]|nr:DUF1730 domain-containing protein [Clostridia bacterium]
MNIKNIMNGVAPLWGVCRFEDIRAHLIDCRAKSRLPENAKSVIVACFPYLLDEENYKNSNVSKYAAVTDYHDVALNRLQKACEKLKKLFPENSFVPFADNSPIPEVRAAIHASLGVRGKNSLLITKDYGSYVFLGEIVTDLEIPANQINMNNCIGCGKCIESCPARAISESGVDGVKCLSAITQKKGELTEREKELMINCGCAWGCDICQDICPMNRNAAKTDIEEFISSCIPILSDDTSLEGRAYAWRGKKVVDRNLSILNKEKTPDE